MNETMTDTISKVDLENEFRGQMRARAPAQRVPLNVKDKKILFELSQNARYSTARIGRIAGISRELVKYHIQKLQDAGVITGFVTLLDTRKIGYQGYLVYVSMQTPTRKKEEEILTFLIKNKRTEWVASCGGSYTFVFSAWCRQKNNFNLLLDELRARYGKHIKKFLILEYITESYLPQHHLLEGIHYNTTKKYPKNDGSFDNLFRKQRSSEGREQTFATTMSHTPQFVLDEKDQKLLEILLRDARIPILELSRRLDLATTSVTRRIEKLIQNGIIKGFMPLISLPLLGLEWYMTFLDLQDPTAEKRKNRENEKEEIRKNSDCARRERALFSYLYHHPYILWYVTCRGAYTLQLSIFAKDSAHYRQIMSDIIEKFSDIIKSYDFTIIFKQHKFVYRV